jgi:hypothetical protein
MEDPSIVFRQKLAQQVEVCARKILERLQKDLQKDQTLTPQDVFYLASASELLLNMRDIYGKK